MLSSLLGLVYLLEVPARAFFGSPPEDSNRPDDFHEAPWPSLLAMIVTALVTLGLFFNPAPFFDLMKMVVAP